MAEAQASREELPDGERDAPPLYGEERLADVARSHRGAAARVLLDALMESVQSFARGAVQADDITVVIVRHVPGADRPAS
jgi:serine phosphatase RsbU (regulator of sigma subunit)